MQGYCIKCKCKKEIADATEHMMKNGRCAIKGRCPDCGSVMVKVIGTIGKVEERVENLPNPGEPER